MVNLKRITRKIGIGKKTLKPKPRRPSAVPDGRIIHRPFRKKM